MRQITRLKKSPSRLCPHQNNPRTHDSCQRLPMDEPQYRSCICHSGLGRNVGMTEIRPLPVSRSRLLTHLNQSPDSEDLLWCYQSKGSLDTDRKGKQRLPLYSTLLLIAALITSIIGILPLWSANLLSACFTHLGARHETLVAVALGRIRMCLVPGFRPGVTQNFWSMAHSTRIYWAGRTCSRHRHFGPTRPS
nr:hypothetical protein CFP56_02482 [Quercus suber]